MMKLNRCNDWRSVLMLAFLMMGTLMLTAAKAERVRFLDKDFVVYWVDPQKDELSLNWRDAAGKPLASFSKLREHLKPNEVIFAINGGIYSMELAPLGLHIEKGRELQPLNLKSLEGGQYNFYLKPNGVFYIAEGAPGVMESTQFAAARLKTIWACQSGPLLLTNGVVHPAFRPASTNFWRRSGVGATRDRQVVFALSLQALRFHDFARLFKEKLNCDDALYLDGEICQVYLPELGYTNDARASFAAMWAVTAKGAGKNSN